MENLNERIEDIEKDTEVTSRLLGALGLYSCLDDIYVNPPEPESRWIVRGED